MPVKLSQIPFIRIFIPFALGIISELYFQFHLLFFFIGIISSGFIFFLIWRENKAGAKYSLRWIYGALAALFLFSSGYCLTYLDVPKENVNYVGKIAGQSK